MLRSAVAVSFAAGVLAGCGGSSQDNGVASKPPGEILQSALAAANGAHAVHVAGSVVSGGSPVTLDLHLVSGVGASGQLSENGLSFQLVSVGNTVYINGSPAFYKRFGGAAAAQLFQGKWLKAPASNASFGSLTTLTNFHQFFSSAFGSHGTLTKGATSTVNGQKAVAINDATQGGTVYVAATGSPFPIEVAKQGAGGGRVVFDHWNQPVSLKAPANAIDITQFKSP